MKCLRKVESAKLGRDAGKAKYLNFENLNGSIIFSMKPNTEYAKQAGNMIEFELISNFEPRGQFFRLLNYNERNALKNETEEFFQMLVNEEKKKIQDDLLKLMTEFDQKLEALAKKYGYR